MIKKPESTNNTNSIEINRGSNSLNFEYVLDGSQDFVTESYTGFQDANYYDIDSISVKSLRETGNFYTVIAKTAVNKNGWVAKPDFQRPEILNIDERTMWIHYGNVSMFERLDRVPSQALKLLYKRRKGDERNYIKEYLNVDVNEIKMDCPVSAQPKGPRKLVLPKEELVYLKEIKGAWQKIEYERNDELQQGWVERKYLK